MWPASAGLNGTGNHAELFNSMTGMVDKNGGSTCSCFPMLHECALPILAEFGMKQASLSLCRIRLCWGFARDAPAACFFEAFLHEKFAHSACAKLISIALGSLCAHREQQVKLGRLNDRPQHKKKTKGLLAGALAVLMAARQLVFFTLNCQVLEARSSFSTYDISSTTEAIKKLQPWPKLPVVIAKQKSSSGCGFSPIR